MCKREKQRFGVLLLAVVLGMLLGVVILSNLLSDAAAHSAAPASLCEEERRREQESKRKEQPWVQKLWHQQRQRQWEGRQQRRGKPVVVHEQGQVKVLIYSRARSGSSFLGSFFDQSPDVLYFFEPLWKDMVYLNQRGADAEKHALQQLSMLFDCRLSVSWISYFLSPTAREFLKMPGRGLFFQRMFVEASSGASLLQNADNLDDLQRRVNGHCKNRSHVVAKCIDRLKSLESIESIWSDRFHVVFLVRDPRAVAQSRLGLRFDANMNMTFDFLCGSALSDIRFLRRKLADDSANNVIIVRYEDLVHDPLRISQLLFRFVNLSLDAHVTTWLHSLHHASANNTDRFSLHRNPSQITEKWRHSISAPTLTDIQSNPLCQSYMQLFGYIPIQFSDVADLQVRTLNTWYNGDRYVDFIRNTILEF